MRTDFHIEELEYKLHKREGVIVLTFKEPYGSYDGVVTKEIAKRIIETRHEFQNDQTMPLVVLDNGTKEVEREALKLFASEWCLKYTSKLAVRIFRPNFMDFFNFLMMRMVSFFSERPIPIKMVRSMDDGIKWLNKQTTNKRKSVQAVHNHSLSSSESTK